MQFPLIMYTYGLYLAIYHEASPGVQDRIFGEENQKVPLMVASYQERCE